MTALRDLVACLAVGAIAAAVLWLAAHIIGGRMTGPTHLTHTASATGSAG
jgi:hypothetical protein